MFLKAFVEEAFVVFLASVTARNPWPPWLLALLLQSQLRLPSASSPFAILFFSSSYKDIKDIGLGLTLINTISS